jgi:hypothetical protein
MRGAQSWGQCRINMETKKQTAGRGNQQKTRWGEGNLDVNVKSTRKQKNKPQEEETNKQHDEGSSILWSMWNQYGNKKTNRRKRKPTKNTMRGGQSWCQCKVDTETKKPTTGRGNQQKTKLSLVECCGRAARFSLVECCGRATRF